MKLNRDTAIGISAIVLLVILLVWLFSARGAAHPNPAALSATSTLETSASTTPALFATSSPATHTATSTRAAPISSSPQKANPLPLDPRDTISSWTLPTSLSTSTRATLRTKIHTLLAAVGTKRYPLESIYLQVAQYYEFLGEGKQAYNFYLRAAQSDPVAGVAFSDLGNLMVRLGAYHTAYTAYGRSVYLQPRIAQFWLAYLNFLSQHEATAPATPAIFAAAKTATDNNPQVLAAEAQWREKIGNINGAIADWELVRASAPPAAAQAIDAKIAALKKQQSSQ